MAKWKLCRQTYGEDIYELTEGDQVTIGRGTQNTIVIPSLNISRKHCVISVKKNEVIIEDLKSANGIFIGLKKIQPNTPFSLSENDIIGLGWTDGVPLAKINDAEKFVFKLVKTASDCSIIDRIQFQNENEIIPTETHHPMKLLPQKTILEPSSKLSLKRKSSNGTPNHGENSINCLDKKGIPVNSTEQSNNLSSKKVKFDFNYENIKEEPIINMANEDEQYEAFNIKQECFDDEVQIVDSDSDSEQWYIRLSQNSPRKSFTPFNDSKKSEDCQQDSSYSQLDDDVIYIGTEDKIKNEIDAEQYEDDLFTILPPPVCVSDGISSNKSIEISNDIKKESENDVTPELNNVCNVSTEKNITPSMDKIDGSSVNNNVIVKDNEMNKKNQSDKSQHPTSLCNESIEKSKDSKHLLPPTRNKLDGTPDRIKKIMNACNNTNQKELNNIIMNEIEAKKSYVSSSETTVKNHNKISRKIQITDFISQPNKKCRHNSKGKIKKKYNKSESSLTKIQITNSQKEERKKKLREIATKDKGDGDHLYDSNMPKNEDCGTSTSKMSSKVTTSNRGAFLTEVKQLLSKPTNKKKDKQDNRDTQKYTKPVIHENECKEPNKISTTKSLLNNEINNHTETRKNETEAQMNELKSAYNKYRTLSADSTTPLSADVPKSAVHRRHSHNINKECANKNNSLPSKEKGNENSVPKSPTEKPKSKILQFKHKEQISLEKSNINLTKNSVQDKTNPNQKENSVQLPLQEVKLVTKPSIKSILKPMKENKEPNRKSKKRVHFSDVQPEILEFEIEQGNQMKKTSNVRTTLIPTHHNIPAFSLQKIALMKILRWNPQWLEEQNSLSEPPPILGHNNIPMAILHYFNSHTQYVELLGDLLLMEIWGCLTQGYMKTRTENKFLEMRIDSLPFVPPQRRGLELINLNVNVSVPTVQALSIPREGELLMMFYFGENIKTCRFFFVHNVRPLPSPPNNVNSFYTISLQTSFTDKIRTLQRGAVMYGKSLGYINKDLRLFEAMEYLSRSPLVEVILNPQPRHFALDEADRNCNLDSQWTKCLNDSQREAVTCAVSAARGERPRIHMIQGPPGTGKSRVICAIVMEYFYDAASKKQKNRGKILLCATGNAAVDELVIRLLDIRQSLPQPERLKLVRVGRVEAMHPRARDISSLKLAQRDVARLQPDPAAHCSSLSEISLLEAKKNMWQTKATSTDDAARKAYCQNRVAEISKKIAMFRSGTGAACAPEQLAGAERRVLEGADVVLTTLASAHSHKMRGLVGRIALCVVDEAGQAIEPETLVPLTLGVTRVALVGDPQQLPGFICSQRAKDHGLGESLFSRLSSCAESWRAGGPILLDRQYRMHPHIAFYPNRAFYDGRVRDQPPPAPALDIAPYFVLGIDSGDYGQDASGANDAEAWGVARVALALRSRLAVSAHSAGAHSLAVITPYAAQRDLVRRHLRTLLHAAGAESGDSGGGGVEECEVEVNTVDSFQGQERSVVVVSLARSHGPGFLAAAGRMNVMLTRAKHALVLCLNPTALEKNRQWSSLVEDARNRNMYGTLPIQMCQHPSIHNVTHQEILQYLSCHPPVSAQSSHKPGNRRSKRSNRNRRQKHKM